MVDIRSIRAWKSGPFWTVCLIRGALPPPSTPPPTPSLRPFRPWLRAWPITSTRMLLDYVLHIITCIIWESYTFVPNKAKWTRVKQVLFPPGFVLGKALFLTSCLHFTSAVLRQYVILHHEQVKHEDNYFKQNIYWKERKKERKRYMDRQVNG